MKMLTIALGLLPLLLAPAPTPDASPVMDEGAETLTLEVRVKGVKSSSGKVYCALYASSSGFPSKARRAYQTTETKAANGTVTCTFAELGPGIYAVSTYHDENGNGKMDSSAIGIPREPWGVSRDAKPGMASPPKFSAARFKLTEDRTIKINLRD